VPNKKFKWLLGMSSKRKNLKLTKPKTFWQKPDDLRKILLSSINLQGVSGEENKKTKNW